MDEIIVKYNADVDELQAKIEKLIEALERVKNLQIEINNIPLDITIKTSEPAE